MMTAMYANIKITNTFETDNDRLCVVVTCDVRRVQHRPRSCLAPCIDDTSSLIAFECHSRKTPTSLNHVIMHSADDPRAMLSGNNYRLIKTVAVRLKKKRECHLFHSIQHIEKLLTLNGAFRTVGTYMRPPIRLQCLHEPQELKYMRWRWVQQWAKLCILCLWESLATEQRACRLSFFRNKI